MPATKIAISVPAEVLREVDRAARARGKTRSGFITDLLRAAARARSDARITRQLTDLFSDPEIQEDQRRTAHELAGLRSEPGTEW